MIDLKSPVSEKRHIDLVEKLIILSNLLLTIGGLSIVMTLIRVAQYRFGLELSGDIYNSIALSAFFMGGLGLLILASLYMMGKFERYLVPKKSIVLAWAYGLFLLFYITGGPTLLSFEAPVQQQIMEIG